MSDFSQLDDLLRIVSEICGRHGISMNTISDKLDRIKRRRNNLMFYIGITGEFNTGKSTLVNAIVDYPLFVAGSTQGTTTTPTIIEYSSEINLAIELKNGKRIYYGRSKLYLLRKYVPKIYKSLSFIHKMQIFSLDVLGRNGYDNEFSALLESITTSNINSNIKNVFVQCPSERLKQGLVVIDMPGIDSFLYSHHEKIAIETLEMCDMTIIAMSPQKNINDELVSFVKQQNLFKSKRVVFFVTMMDLVKSQPERDSIIEQLVAKIREKLEIEKIKIVSCPTLLYLETKYMTTHNGTFNFLSHYDKKQLIETFESELNDLFIQLNEAKYLLIYEQLINIIKILVNCLENVLDKSRKEHNRILVDTRMNQTIALEDFICENMAFDYFQYVTSLKSRLERKSIESSSCIFNKIKDKICASSTKDETQAVFTSLEIENIGKRLFKELYEYFLSVSDELFHSYENEYINFSQSFQAKYNLTIPMVEYKSEFKLGQEIGYKLIYRKNDLTTNIFVRRFKKLDTIKAQAREVADTAALQTFSRALCCYANYVDNMHKKMDSVRNTLLIRCRRNMSSIIDKRIECEISKINLLEMKIDSLEKDSSLISLKLLELNKIIDNINIK